MSAQSGLVTEPKQCLQNINIRQPYWLKNAMAAGNIKNSRWWQIDCLGEPSSIVIMVFTSCFYNFSWFSVAFFIAGDILGLEILSVIMILIKKDGKMCRYLCIW